MLDGKGKIEVKRSICTHCSAGCAVDATVENGVWVRQDPVFDSPINMGAHVLRALLCVSTVMATIAYVTQ